MIMIMNVLVETDLTENTIINDSEPKTIFILLVRYTDTFSKLANFIMRGKYTHASIGLSGDKRTFFSFNTVKGFCIERPVKRKRKNDCELYRLGVSEETYADIETRICNFRSNAVEYKYNFIGAFLGALRIPVRFKKRYFCSQFVSELLALSGAAEIKRKPALYFPKHFAKEPQLELCYQGTLCGLAEVS